MIEDKELYSIVIHDNNDVKVSFVLYLLDKVFNKKLSQGLDVINTIEKTGQAAIISLPLDAANEKLKEAKSLIDINESLLKLELKEHADLCTITAHTDKTTSESFFLYLLCSVFEKDKHDFFAAIKSLEKTGTAVIDSLSFDEATRKLEQANKLIEKNGYQLKLTLDTPYEANHNKKLKM